MRFCIGLMKRSFRILQTLCLKLLRSFHIEIYDLLNCTWPDQWCECNFFSQQTLNTFWIDLNYFRFGRYHQLIWIVLARVCAIFWMTYMVMPLPFWFLFISQKISYIICTIIYILVFKNSSLQVLTYCHYVCLLF